MLAAGGEDHAVHVWDIINNSLQHKFTTIEHTNYVWSLAFSPDSKKLATGSRDEKFRISNVEDAKTLNMLGGHSWRVNCFAFLNPHLGGSAAEKQIPISNSPRNDGPEFLEEVDLETGQFLDPQNLLFPDLDDD